ncbi:YaaW family protein [Pelagibaculum spongiae]|uniref:DUF3944 domain-containing protein n=1 Tax=Pelagibaculum spongiae TaxID=2080658 RepID=A0A2V1GRX8_9GAMM|nr:YaaW family protein [Pelagibaculum spongiae]PVZ64476.1 hypothetical protein DC094_19375 [Pelagibaculum spongiae]
MSTDHKKYQSVLDDHDLFPMLEQATTKEKKLISTVIAEKISSNIESSCTNSMKIGRELQLMGGNSAVNLFRGDGVKYKELAYDAAKKVRAKVKSNDSIETIEWELLTTLVKKAVEKMNEQDKEQFFAELEESTGQAFNWKNVAMDQLFKIGVPGAAGIYLALAEIAIPQILRALGITAAVGFIGGRAAAAAIPVVGWGLAIGSIFQSMAGTAYSVTIPCTAYLGAIRARINANSVAAEIFGDL